MHERSALDARKDLLVDIARKLFLTEDHAAARAAQGFMGGGGYEIGMRHRVGVASGGHESGDVGHVDHQVGADTVGDFAQFLEIDNA